MAAAAPVDVHARFRAFKRSDSRGLEKGVQSGQQGAARKEEREREGRSSRDETTKVKCSLHESPQA